MKFCNSCGCEKPLSEFHKRNGRPLGVASNCKTCVSKRERARYKKNKTRIISRVREYNEQNRERINARQREYNKKNKSKAREYAARNRDAINRKRREKLKNDPVAAMSDRFRRRLNYAIKNIGLRKTKSSLEFLGCSFEEFVKHIESQFKEGMSWENRKDWEIDHIIPMRLAKDEEDVVRLSHYTNLQPLWRSENRKKSGKLL